MFVPHECKTTVAVSQPPRIIISVEAHKKMWQYVDQCDVEIGWLGVVEREGLRFTIKDIFLPQQNVSLVTTEMTEQGLLDLAQEILQRSDGMEIWPKMLFWGHSHVDMKTSPSSVDDKQMETFEKNDVPYFIRGIFNKHGDASFDLFLYESGIVIHDVPWSYEPAELCKPDETIQQEMDDKLTRKTLARAPFRPDWFNLHRYDLHEEDNTIVQLGNPDEDRNEESMWYEDQNGENVWRVGDRVVVDCVDGKEYAGTIRSFTTDKAIIDFDDGDEGTALFDDLRNEEVVTQRDQEED